MRYNLVEQEIRQVSNKSKSLIIKIVGFFLSSTIIYFIVVWTLELRTVNIEDLPIISVIDKDFKKVPPENLHENIENLNLSINVLKEGKIVEKNNYKKLQDTIEPNLHDDEVTVSINMEKDLQNSISNALKSLQDQELFSFDENFYLYLGSFEDEVIAKKKLQEIQQNDELRFISEFSVLKKQSIDDKKIFRIISIDHFLHQKAKDHCETFQLYDLECKVILDL